VVGMTKADRAIAVTATGQLGAFTRAQAHDAGLSDDQLRSRIQSGFLEQIGPNAFRQAGTGSTALARLRGLILDVGAPCWAAGPTAAALHGLDGFRLDEPFHLVTLRDRQVRRAGHVIHTTVYLPLFDQTEIDGVPVVRPTRTIIDLARIIDRAQLSAALDAAIRDGMTSEEALHRRIARLRGHGRFGIGALIDVLEGNEVSRGGHSFLEREFLRLLAAHGLPRPTCQQVLGRAGDRLVRVDFRFPGTSVVVEVMGYRYHRTKQQLARDAERMNALLAQGMQPYQFTYEQVMGDTSRMIDTIADAVTRLAS
jgi:very-short-patch-repair endonuclease